ncbi:hypothetical protein VM98_22060 [Streptomyces rubellomurinus subsp. indigoferus]|nr:hypothetical protein VM98_22060 [Streptomyces rubellomurinus subsp. indigoferus]
MEGIGIEFRKIDANGGAHTLSLPVDTKLKEVRSELEAAGFITPDGSGDTGPQYRFLEVSTKSRRDFDQKLGFVEIDNEDEIDLRKVLHRSGNNVYSVNVVDVLAKRAPLVGIATDSFVDHYLRVRVLLNTTDAAKPTNSKPGTFEPIMLTDVRVADKSRPSVYDNVCIAFDGSRIGEGLRLWLPLRRQRQVVAAAGAARSWPAWARSEVPPRCGRLPEMAR